MRQTLTKVDIAFEEGYHSHEEGTHRVENPYNATSEYSLRDAWFAGWDRAQQCAGSCND